MPNPTVRRTLLAALVAASLATGYGLVAAPLARAQDAKNLKVLPKTMSKADIKKLMKAQASALGVQCEYCHDIEDFPKDTEHKEVARQMMLMTTEINKTHFKGEQVVGCVTCHNGKKEPKTLRPPKK